IGEYGVPGAGSGNVLHDREPDQVRRGSATSGRSTCGHGMDTGGASVAVDKRRGNDFSVEYREEGHQGLVRVRVGPRDVEGRAEFGTFALRGPERGDEVQIFVRRRSYLNRWVGRPGRRTLREQEDEGGGFRPEAEPAKSRVDMVRNRLWDTERRPQGPLKIVVQRVFEEGGLSLSSHTEFLDEVEARHRKFLVSDERGTGDFEGKPP